MFNWLQNGGSVDDERDSSTPYFFCGDSWIIRQSMSDTLRRSDGEEAKNNKGELMKIIDDKDKVKIKETTAERYKNSKSTTYKDSDGNVKIYPVSFRKNKALLTKLNYYVSSTGASDFSRIYGLPFLGTRSRLVIAAMRILTCWA